MSRPAKLALSDGTVFTGTAFGADGEVFGEVPIALGTVFPVGFRASEPTRVLRIDPADYHAVASIVPEVAEEVGRLAAHRMGGARGLQGIAADPPPPRAIVLGNRWDPACAELRHFLDRGLVKPPLFVQSVFGILGGIGPHPEDIMMMKRTADRLLGDNYHWSVLGAGANQMRVAATAAAMGGNVRVGLEDSLWLGPGKLAETNAQQVTQVRKILEGLGLEIATPDEAREIISLKGGDKVGF